MDTAVHDGIRYTLYHQLLVQQRLLSAVSQQQERAELQDV